MFYTLGRSSCLRSWIRRLALVTGGGTGLGKTIASALVQNGAKVYIAARKEESLKQVGSALGRQGRLRQRFF